MAVRLPKLLRRLTGDITPQRKIELACVAMKRSAWLWRDFSAPTLNFIVTSVAEIRVFTPLLLKIAEMPEVKANIIYLSVFKLPNQLEYALSANSNINISSSVMTIARSCMYPRKSANVICLDHRLHYEYHFIGVDVIRTINERGGKSICLQHGGISKRNIEGHKTSESKFQVVWGKRIFDELTRSENIQKENMFMTGNPLHDKICSLNSVDVLRRLNAYIGTGKPVPNGKNLILLATCLHSEYADRENPADLYRRYIRAVYSAVDFGKSHLIVKMHPVDSLDPNIYEEHLKESDKEHVTILPPDSEFSFYELASVAKVVITRASTTAEESLIMGKVVLAFDLFEDGPMCQLRYLEGYPNFETVCQEAQLAAKVNELINQTAIRSGVAKDLITEITYKLDGNSTNRALDVLIRLATAPA